MTGGPRAGRGATERSSLGREERTGEGGPALGGVSFPEPPDVVRSLLKTGYAHGLGPEVSGQAKGKAKRVGRRTARKGQGGS